MRRGVQLALVSTGLVTALAAAQQLGGKPDDNAMNKTITQQRVAAGQRVTTGAPGATGAPESSKPSGDAPSPRDAILAEATTLMVQMEQAIKHAGQLKNNAYQAKDIIKMNYIATKMDEMGAVLAVAQAAYAEIQKPGQDLFVMRAKLSIIRQGWDQVKTAAAAAEATQGDEWGESIGDVGQTNIEGNPSKGETDPTAAASPTADVDRPTQASPYQ